MEHTSHARPRLWPTLLIRLHLFLPTRPGSALMLLNIVACLAGMVAHPHPDPRGWPVAPFLIFAVVACLLALPFLAKMLLLHTPRGNPAVIQALWGKTDPLPEGFLARLVLDDLADRHVPLDVHQTVSGLSDLHQTVVCTKHAHPYVPMAHHLRLRAAIADELAHRYGPLVALALLDHTFHVQIPPLSAHAVMEARARASATRRPH